MSAFYKCEVPGCEEEARAGGKCVPHARAAVLSRRDKPPAGEEDTPAPRAAPPPVRVCSCGAPLTPKARSGKCEACRRKLAQDKYRARKQAPASGQDKKEKEGMKTATCDECKRELKEGERVYKGRCADCRAKGKPRKAARGVGKAKIAAAPKTTSQRLLTAGDDVVSQLQAKLKHHIKEAGKIRTTLTTIKELTGANFEIPEIG